MASPSWSSLELALADLRRSNLRLGTLFLVEGFSSLDEDTLGVQSQAAQPPPGPAKGPCRRGR